MNNILSPGLLSHRTEIDRWEFCINKVETDQPDVSWVLLLEQLGDQKEKINSTALGKDQKLAF